MSGQIYVVSGPSGAGKSTIIRRVRMVVPGLGYSISHTSRKPRSHEVNGREYHFVDGEVFERMIQQGLFVEWAQVYEDLYGTSFESLENLAKQGLDVIMDVDSQGARNIQGRFRESVLIYVVPPSMEALQSRLSGRGTDAREVVEMRMGKALEEMKSCEWYHYILINENLEEVTERLKSIILATRCTRSRMLPKVREIFGKGQED